MNRKRAIAALALATLPLAACSVQLGPGEMGVIAEDYILIPAAPELLGCQQPETSEFYHSKRVYRYPARQISWDATGESGAEAPATVVVSSAEAPAELTVPVTVTFDLTTDCDALMEFHREFGVKYGGWLNDDGTVSEGWINLLRYVIGQPLENTLVSVAQKSPWRQIWNDEKVRVEFQNALRETLPKVSKERTNGKEYFTNFQVTVMKPDLVDQNLKASINAEQRAIADAARARSKAEEEIAVAKKETEVARERALQKAAEIAGYPSVDDYLKEKLIEKGGNPYQPVIVPGMP